MCLPVWMRSGLVRRSMNNISLALNKYPYNLHNYETCFFYFPLAFYNLSHVLLFSGTILLAARRMYLPIWMRGAPAGRNVKYKFQILLCLKLSHVPRIWWLIWKLNIHVLKVSVVPFLTICALVLPTMISAAYQEVDYIC